MKRRIVGLACFLFLFLSLPTTALAASNVPYIDADGDSTVISEAREVTGEHAQLTRGWYVVYGDVTISDRIKVSGDGSGYSLTNLILADGCTLTASKGIEIDPGANLVIYAQTEDDGAMGTLRATASIGMGAIALRMSPSSSSSLTINGGRIEAESSFAGAAIGGGYNAPPGGPVTINGGIVNALATGGGAAIGGGKNMDGRGRGGTVKITGGSVTASSTKGAAIGGGEGNSDHGTLTIAPKASRIISASTGGSAETATALADSPFMSGASVQVPSDEMGGRYFSSDTEKPLTVSYLDENGDKRTRDDCFSVAVDDTRWTSGWYAVDSDVSVGGRIVVKGDAKLILTDGKALNVKGGIEVAKGNSLTIYAQSTDKDTMGSLTATTRAPGFADCAAIGGSNAEGVADAGAITIHGGTVTANNAGGYSRAAGIGGAFWYPDGDHNKVNAGKGGTVTITGGVVTALGGWNAAGIGGAQRGDGGSVTITGGVVNASGGVSYGSAIGGGQQGDGGTVLITGGLVTATTASDAGSFNYAAAIGGGGVGSTVSWVAGDGADVTITGGTVVAQACEGMNAIGAGKSPASASKTNPGTLKIAPAQGEAIAANAGAGEAGATPIDGSPFTAEREIVDLVQSASYFRSTSGSVDGITRIAAQPEDVTVDEGDPATFEVSASGMGTLSYQWQQRSGADGEWTDIEGAGGASYTMSATTADMDGMQVRCVVTGELGIATSDFATLAVIPKPVFEISLDTTAVDFGKLVEGSFPEQGQSATVVISNTGNQSLEVQLPESQAFELKLEAPSKHLDPGDTVDVSIKPKEGLVAGAYSERIVVSGVSGQDGATATLELSATVVHDLAKVEAKPATCTEAGNNEYWTCDACGKIFGDADGEKEIKLEDVVLPATGHDPADGWEADADGHWHACLNGCGERLDYAKHAPETVDAKDPTCSDDGYEGDTVCSVCGRVLAKGEAIPATGHDWGGRRPLQGLWRDESRLHPYGQCRWRWGIACQDGRWLHIYRDGAFRSRVGGYRCGGICDDEATTLVSWSRAKTISCCCVGDGALSGGRPQRSHHRA